MGGRVLSVASECVPLVKTGGWPMWWGRCRPRWRPHGWDMRVLMPGLSVVAAAGRRAGRSGRGGCALGRPGRVLAGRWRGCRCCCWTRRIFMTGTAGPIPGRAVDFGDNAQRFAALSWAAARIARDGLEGWKPDVLHAHDWQAGLRAGLSGLWRRWGRAGRSHGPQHRLSGLGRPRHMLGVLRLPGHEFHPGALEYYGGLSTLKAGLVTADRITTVSPTYAAELMRPEFGMGLQGVIAARAPVVSGILNGVDTDVWNPAGRGDRPIARQRR
jgi:starch synthase